MSKRGSMKPSSKANQYPDHLEPYYRGIDVCFVGLEKASKDEKTKHLAPYEIKIPQIPLSADGTISRVKIVDKVLQTLQKL